MTADSEPYERRAVVTCGPTVTVVTEQMPALAADHVRVRVHIAGICHSDIAAIAGAAPDSVTHVGHEAAGTVIASTSAAVAVGTRVVAYATDAYAEFVDVPADRVAPLDEGCSMLDGALAEPVACVIGAIEMLDLGAIDEIVLIGAGFMGLVTVRALALQGHRVTVFEPLVERQQAAERAGAVRALPPETAREQYPVGTALVIEATGSPAGLALASDLASIAGTLGILGYHQSQGGMRSVPMESWNYRALTVRSLHHRDPADIMRWIDRAQRSAAQGGIVPSLLVDATFTLDEAADALRSRPASESPVKGSSRMRV